MVINIAICDDEQRYIDEIVSNIHDSDIPCEYKIYTFTNSADFLKSNINYQIVFVDVELNEEKDGFAIVREFKKASEDTVIVFVTTHEEMSTEGYLVNAFRYIYKRNMSEKIKEAIKSALTLIDGNRLMEFEIVGNKKFFVPVKNIVYMESEKRYARLHLKDGSYPVRGTIEIFSNDLLDSGFVRPHRSFLVNCTWVERIDTRDIIMKNGDKIPISRLKKQEIIMQIAINKSR